MPQASRHILLFIEVSDVPGGIITARGAARLRTRVTRARETVTGLVTAGSMTATPAAEATWSAGATTAGSLVCITMRRTTAARGRAPGEGGQEAPALGQGARGGLAGPSGAASAPAAPPAALALENVCVFVTPTPGVLSVQARVTNFYQIRDRNIMHCRVIFFCTFKSLNL